MVDESKKRGRPKKTKNIQSDEQNNDEEEIVLHIPLKFDDITFAEAIEARPKQSIFMEAEASANSNSGLDSDNDNSDEDSFFYSANKKPKQNKNKNEIIQKLQQENDYYKSILSKMIDDRNNNIRKLDNKIVDGNGDLVTIKEHTDVACWWCSHDFEGIPCFIPNKYENDVYHIFGCFCSFNCAVAYNMKMDDYKIWHRYSLIKKIWNDIHDNNSTEEINPSPPKEILERFGGYLTIDEYRNNNRIFLKKHRIIMPPMTSMALIVEEVNNGSKERKEANDGLVLKRSKPLSTVRHITK